MKVLIEQLLKYNDIDEFTNFLVYQSVRSTVTLINENKSLEMKNILIYLEWLLINTQHFLKLNINKIQPLVVSSFQNLIKNQPLYHTKLLYLLNILKSLKSQNINHQVNYKDANTLQEDINYFLTEQKENSDIIQSLQNLKLKVSIVILLLELYYK